MNADTEITFEQLQTTICAAIQAKFPDLQAVEFDREERTELPLPCCLLDLPEFEGEMKIDPGTGQLAAMAKFEAEFILGFRTPRARLSARTLAASFAAFIHQARWPGGHCGPVEHIHAYKSDFKPELDQYEVWCVEWHQVVHLGTSVWHNDGSVPNIIFSGITPEIGTGNEGAYVQIEPQQ